MRQVSRRTLLRTSTAAAAATALPAGLALAQTPPAPDTEWRSYAGDLAYTRYTPLTQINADNFNKLQIAWRFRTGFLGTSAENNLEATPLLVKGQLFLTCGHRRDVVCLDARSGELIWMYRMDEGQRARNAPRQLSGRGVGYWTDGTKERIIFVTTG